MIQQSHDSSTKQPENTLDPNKTSHQKNRKSETATTHTSITLERTQQSLHGQKNEQPHTHRATTVPSKNTVVRRAAPIVVPPEKESTS
jgi:hypothetical protein